MLITTWTDYYASWSSRCLAFKENFTSVKVTLKEHTTKDLRRREIFVKKIPLNLDLLACYNFDWHFFDLWTTFGARFSNLLFKQQLWNPCMSGVMNYHANAQHTRLFVFKNLSYKFMHLRYWNASLLIKFFTHILPIIFSHVLKLKYSSSLSFLSLKKKCCITDWFMKPNFLCSHSKRLKQDYRWSCPEEARLSLIMLLRLNISL